MYKRFSSNIHSLILATTFVVAIIISEWHFVPFTLIENLTNLRLIGWAIRGQISLEELGGILDMYGGTDNASMFSSNNVRATNVPHWRELMLGANLAQVNVCSTDGDMLLLVDLQSLATNNQTIVTIKTRDATTTEVDTLDPIPNLVSAKESYLIHERLGPPFGYRVVKLSVLDSLAMVYEDPTHGMVVELSNKAEDVASSLHSYDIRVDPSSYYLVAVQTRILGTGQPRVGVAWFSDKPKGTLPDHRIDVVWANECNQTDEWRWHASVLRSPENSKYAQLWLDNSGRNARVRFDNMLLLKIDPRAVESPIPVRNGG